MIKKLFIILFLILIAGYIFICYSLSNRILNPGSSLERTKERMVEKWGTTYKKVITQFPEPEDFSLQSFDKISLKGKYFQHPDTADCAVIFAHGWTSTWADMLKYAPIFWDCGCDLVLFDHRAHGESGGEYPTGGINESKDLLAVTNWFQEKTGFTDAQIGWMGASWGGATVLQAGANEKNVAFIVSDAPFQDWYSAIFERAIRDYGSGINLLSYGVMQMVNWRAGIDYKNANALAVASEIEEPVLLIHSKHDAETHHEQSINIAEALDGDISVFYLLNWGGGHTQDVLINRDKFTQIVHEFLSKEVGGFGDCF